MISQPNLPVHAGGQEPTKFRALPGEKKATNLIIYILELINA
jgi:hypothetical protein